MLGAEEARLVRWVPPLLVREPEERALGTWGDNHGTRYVRQGRGGLGYPVRTVRGALGQAALRLQYVPNARGWYASPVRTPWRRRGVRVSSARDPAL